MLPFARGIPSHDTLNDAVNALDPALFPDCLTAWVEILRESEPDFVAVNGKSSRRARRGNAHPLHVVSAWASRQRLVLGQQAVDEKDNEIVAIAAGRSDGRQSRPTQCAAPPLPTSIATGSSASARLKERPAAAAHCKRIARGWARVKT